MIPPFEEVLEKFLADCQGYEREEIISALELKLYALKEEEAAEDGE